MAISQSVTLWTTSSEGITDHFVSPGYLPSHAASEQDLSIASQFKMVVSTSIAGQALYACPAVAAMHVTHPRLLHTFVLS